MLLSDMKEIKEHKCLYQLSWKTIWQSPDKMLQTNQDHQQKQMLEKQSNAMAEMVGNTVVGQELYRQDYGAFVIVNAVFPTCGSLWLQQKVPG